MIKRRPPTYATLTQRLCTLYALADHQASDQLRDRMFNWLGELLFVRVNNQLHTQLNGCVFRQLIRDI